MKINSLIISLAGNTIGLAYVAIHYINLQVKILDLIDFSFIGMLFLIAFLSACALVKEFKTINKRV